MFCFRSPKVEDVENIFITKKINGKEPIVTMGRFSLDDQAVRKLPWILKVGRPSNNMFECQLYEPTNLKATAIDYNIDLNNFVRSYDSRGIGVSCKAGWLLFKIPKQDLRATTFLFFSPLTLKLMLLPEFPHPLASNFYLITAFSTEPDSPDFVFFVLESSGNITTFRRGENRWTTRKYKATNFACDGCIAVYINKIFYIVNRYGQVASYKVGNGRWNVEAPVEDETIIVSNTRHVFELNGDLMLITFDRDDFRYCVRKFDWHEKVWVQVRSVGDRALFVSRNSFSVSTAAEEGVTNHGVLENMIYGITDPGCNVYSAKNGELVNWIRGSGLVKTCDAHIYVGRETNFWFEPLDHFLNRNQKQGSTTRDKADDQSVAHGRCFLGLLRKVL